ncbi:MAG: PTS sugar transporter subunit IIA [Lentisphaeraceae bacterium]|nr:PTS sugar transporter subunit IIA [Lentisphaeraceae bacterium]
MPYTTMSTEEASEYLHLDMRQLNKLIQRREIPYENIRGQVVFRKNHLRDWSTTRILSFKDKHLQDFHGQAHNKQEAPDRHQPFLTGFLNPEYCIDYIPVKSKNKILTFLADKAFETGCVCDAGELQSLLIERESLCPTGLEGGIALPHTRVHSEYLFLENFLIIGRIPGGVPFGAIDNKKTDLFFMPCTKDDQLHLYTITRLALMVRKTDLADRLRDAADIYEMHEVFVETELEFVEKFVDK